MQQTTPQAPAAFPLAPEQLNWLQQFMQTLTPQQMAWLGGYLSGVSMAAGAPAMGSMPMPGAAPAGASEAIPLTILYGTQTGNCTKVAKKALAAAQAKGITATMVEMGDYKTQNLKKEQALMVIVSTHGEGEPPDSVMELYEFINGPRAPKLDGTLFTVLGLGDVSYEHFCQMGKDFDARLEAMGGKRIADRVDCDVDYDDDAAKWIETAIGVYETELAASAPAAGAAPAMGGFGMPFGAVAEPAGVEYDKNAPFTATLLENLVLNDEGSEKETRHLELSIEDSGMIYQPGDSIGILPLNDPDLVDEIIKVTGLDPDGMITAHDGERPLREALLELYDINTLTKNFVEKYAEIAASKKLEKLLASKEKLDAYVGGREVIDLLHDYPAKELTAPVLTALLRKLPPRLYSIASSLEAHPDEVHICVATVRYASAGRERKGVCSTWFAERCAVGDPVKVFVQENRNFKLPESGDTPIIMIGPGTGIAPFRAFVEERETQGAAGGNWLFFGDQHFTTDFLYQTEWQGFLKSGALTRMDVAWSRDQEHKVYVQHKMLENAAELWQWLQDGAAIYVCGDAGRMADDVHQALLQIVREQGGKSEADAVEFVKSLQKAKRYQRDVY